MYMYMQFTQLEKKVSLYFVVIFIRAFAGKKSILIKLNWKK